MTPSEEEQLLTVQECALEAGLNDETLYLAMRSKRLKFVERYGRKLIERREWERYRAETKRGRPRKKESS